MTIEQRIDTLITALDVELKQRDLETVIVLITRILERAEQ